MEVRRLITKGGAYQPHPVRFPTFRAVCTFLFTLAFRKNNSKNELQKNSHKSNDINGFRTFYNRSKY